VQGYFALDQGGVSGPSSEHLPGKLLVGAAIGLRATIADTQAEFFIGTPLAQPAGFHTAPLAAGFSLNTRF
jgi:hemolysin activation/secretion protein